MRQFAKKLGEGGLLPVSLLLAVLLGLASPSLAGDLLVEVPFEFIVNGETLPAGTYQVDVGPGIADPPVVAIQTAPGTDEELRFRKVLTSTTIPADQAEGQPRLVFQKVGDMFFLEKVVPYVGAVQEVR